MKYVGRLNHKNLTYTVYKANISLLRQQKTVTSETQRTDTETFKIITSRWRIFQTSFGKVLKELPVHLDEVQVSFVTCILTVGHLIADCIDLWSPYHVLGITIPAVCLSVVQWVFFKILPIVINTYNLVLK